MFRRDVGAVQPAATTTRSASIDRPSESSTDSTRFFPVAETIRCPFRASTTSAISTPAFCRSRIAESPSGLAVNTTVR